MVSLELSNNSIFKIAFESISVIVDECAIEFSNDGLHVRALDKSHTTFVDLELRKTLFDMYECLEPARAFVDTGELMKILKRMKTSDILKLELDEHNLTLIFEGDATRRYNLRLIDVEYESPAPPNIEYNSTIIVPSMLVSDCLGDLKLFSDNLTFTVDEDYLIINTNGSFGDGEIKYLHGENILEVISSSFSIVKLEEIFKAKKFSETVMLSLGDDMPITICFDLITGDGYLKFMLAPRINEDE